MPRNGCPDGCPDVTQYPLTARQLQIVEARLVEGSTRLAAARLGIHPRTVDNTLAAVYRTCRARDFAQAVYLLRGTGQLVVGRFPK